MIASNDDIDWEHLHTEARRLKCEKSLGLGLYLINDLFGHRTPIVEWQTKKNLELFEKLTRQVRDRLFDEEPESVEMNDRTWFLQEKLFHLGLKDSFWDKLKLQVYHNDLYLKQIFSPNKADKETLPLPAWLSPIYYITRPARLFFTYIVRFKKSKYSKG
jgi:hypothetical protein